MEEVEKKKIKLLADKAYPTSAASDKLSFISGFLKGYKQAKEDNKIHIKEVLETFMRHYENGNGELYECDKETIKEFLGKYQFFMKRLIRILKWKWWQQRKAWTKLGEGMDEFLKIN